MSIKPEMEPALLKRTKREIHAAVLSALGEAALVLRPKHSLVEARVPGFHLRFNVVANDYAAIFCDVRNEKTGNSYSLDIRTTDDLQCKLSALAVTLAQWNTLSTVMESTLDSLTATMGSFAGFICKGYSDSKPERSRREIAEFRDNYVVRRFT